MKSRVCDDAVRMRVLHVWLVTQKSGPHKSQWQPAALYIHMLPNQLRIFIAAMDY